MFLQKITYDDLFSDNPINSFLLSQAWDDLSFKEKIKTLELITGVKGDDKRPLALNHYIIEKAKQDKNPLIQAFFSSSLEHDNDFVKLWAKSRSEEINHFSAEKLNELVLLSLPEKMILLGNSSLNETVVAFFEILAKKPDPEHEMYPLFYSWVNSKMFCRQIDWLEADNNHYYSYTEGLCWAADHQAYKKVWSLLKLKNRYLTSTIFSLFPAIAEEIERDKEIITDIFNYFDEETSFTVDIWDFFEKTKGYFDKEKKELIIKNNNFWYIPDDIKFSEEELKGIEETKRKKIIEMQEEAGREKRSHESMEEFYADKEEKQKKPKSVSRHEKEEYEAIKAIKELIIEQKQEQQELSASTFSKIMYHLEAKVGKVEFYIGLVTIIIMLMFKH